MRTRILLSTGIVGAALLAAGCSKKEPEQTTPEQAAGAKADTTTAQAGAAVDTAAGAAGAYGDTTAAAAVMPDTTGAGAAVDSVKRDSM